MDSLKHTNLWLEHVDAAISFSFTLWFHKCKVAFSVRTKSQHTFVVIKFNSMFGQTDVRTLQNDGTWKAFSLLSTTCVCVLGLSVNKVTIFTPWLVWTTFFFCNPKITVRRPTTPSSSSSFSSSSSSTYSMCLPLLSSMEMNRKPRKLRICGLTRAEGFVWWTSAPCETDS